MNIERFLTQSEGEWQSMRSGHSLAFKQFEEIISRISIKLIGKNDPEVLHILNCTSYSSHENALPIKMNWYSSSDWNENESYKNTSGECILIAIPTEKDKGMMLRSLGYLEPQKAISSYKFLSDGTFTLRTQYTGSYVEERIWFASENVRCRSSIIKTSESSGIMQTSFASEIRSINIKSKQETHF